MNIKTSDWVVCKTSPNITGFVKRVSKKKGWADVDWGRWTKRMPLDCLEVTSTIKIDGGVWTATFTDVAREK